MRGAHRSAEHAAGIRFQSAWNVERQYGAVLRVDVVDQCREIAGNIATEADTEQAVDHKAPAHFSRQPRRILGSQRGYAKEPVFQYARSNPRVAAVVARSGQHQYILARVEDELYGQIGCCQPGALHERRL